MKVDEFDNKGVPHDDRCIERAILQEKKGIEEGWLIISQPKYKLDISVVSSDGPKHIRHKKKRDIICYECNRAILFKNGLFCWWKGKEIKNPNRKRFCKGYKKGKPENSKSVNL